VVVVRILPPAFEDGIVEHTHRLDEVVRNFEAEKDLIKREMQQGETSLDILVGSLLKKAVAREFSSPTDFANTFNSKYQFDRVLQGDYSLYYDSAIHLNRILMMRRFNMDVAPGIISAFSEDLFSQ